MLVHGWYGIMLSPPRIYGKTMPDRPPGSPPDDVAETVGIAV